MEKGGCVRDIKAEEVRVDDPVEYFLPTGIERMRRFLKEGRMEGERESVLLSVGEERIGGHTH